MRPVLTLAAAALTLALPGPAVAGTVLHCTRSADKDDLVVEKKSAEVRAGQVVKNAVVVEGDLTVKAGAVVRNAVVVKGTLRVEKGAVVEESVVVVGGRAVLAEGATVKGSRVEVDDGLHLVGEDGQRLDLALSVDGESVGKRLLAEVLKDVHTCQVDEPAAAPPARTR